MAALVKSMTIVLTKNWRLSLASELKLKKEKCIFGQKELGFAGHRLSQEGIRPDPEKFRAIQDLSKPQNLTELKRILVWLISSAVTCHTALRCYSHWMSYWELT